MRRLLLAIFCALAAALANTPTANAIAVTITYAINAGSFNGPFSSGPITSGTLVVRYPDAVSLFSAPAPGPGSLLALTLTGPSGFFRVPAAVFVPPRVKGSGFIAPGEERLDLALSTPYAPLQLVSGTAFDAVSWTDAGFGLWALGNAYSPRQLLVGAFFGPSTGGGGSYCGCGGCPPGTGHYPRHSFEINAAVGREVSRTCDNPPCPARTPLPTPVPTPTPLPPPTGDVPMCKIQDSGVEMTKMVPPSNVQAQAARGLTLGECNHPSNGRVVCKAKRGKRVNVLLPDREVQKALDTGFCTLGEC